MGLNETGCEFDVHYVKANIHNHKSATPNTSKGPRGIRGFKLDGGTFGDWKVQGKVGGYRK